MKNRLRWAGYEIGNKILSFRKNKNAEKYIGRTQIKAAMSIEETNQKIIEEITKGRAFWLGRMGLIEMNMVRQVIEHRMLPVIDHRESALKQLCMNAGFFPCRMEDGERYVDLILRDSSEITMQAYWGLYMEDYIHDVYQKHTLVTEIGKIEPWRVKCDGKLRPWTSALKGKKVLVVHPFAKSIRMQYERNRERIYQNVYSADDILPEFELHTFQAVQTIGGTPDPRFRNWFEALEWMETECRKIDFDVAIVGCGAYGYNLSAEIRRMGKAVIHLGGATQVLFGIKGKRWEEGYKDLFDRIINEYWVRPLKEETPERFESIEQGCYW